PDQDVSDQPGVWDTSNHAIATMSGRTATGLSPGSVQVIATYQGLSGICNLTVKNKVSSLSCEPNPVSINIAQTQNFTATAHYLSGPDKDVTSSSQWSPPNPFT